MPPVGAAIAGAFGAISGAVAAIGATTIGSFALRLGASLALSAVSRLLMPKPKGPELRPRTLSARQPVAPREIVYGFVRKGGVFVFMHSTGDRDQFLHLAIVLAAHPVQSIGTVYFDGVPAIEADGTPVNRWSSYIAQVEKALGNQTGNPFPQLSAATDIWTGAHQLRGCAAIAMRLEYNADAFPTGIPAISVDIAGKNDILDPRTGIRGYSANPALNLADYMSLADYGLNAQIGSDTGIDTASLIEAANICDEQVPLAGGGTEARYTCNGVLPLSTTPRDAIQTMLTAMAGQAVYRGSRWFILAGAYRAPQTSFGPGDFDERGVQIATRVTMRENFNGVRGQFVSPENDWQPDDFPAYRSAVYLAEDGGEERWKDITLPFTTSASMAQRLAKIELEKTRRQMSVSFSGKLQLYRATAGDTVNFNFPAWGIENKPFSVQSVQFAGDGSDGARLEVTLRETSPLVYSWDASEQEIYDAAPRTNLPSAFNIAAPQNLQATEALYVTSSGSGVRNRVTLTWLPSPSIGVADYEVSFRRLPNGDWRAAGVTSNTTIEINDFEAGPHEFRVRARSALGVTSAFVTLTQEIFGPTVEPVALENVTIQTAGGLAVLKWRQSADIDVRIGGSIVVRHTTASPATWHDSYVMDEVAGSSAIAVVPLKPGTYLVRARDSGGRYGPVSMLTASGAQALAFAPVSSLVADPVFSGTKTDLQVVDSFLTLAAGDNVDDWDDFDAIDNIDFSSLVDPAGLYEFAAGLDFGAVKRVRLRSDIRFIVSNIFDQWDDRPNMIDDWLDIDGSDGAECDVVVEVRTTDDDPAGSPEWSGWGRLDSSEIEARGLQARAQVSTQDPTFAPLIERLRVYADEVA